MSDKWIRPIVTECGPLRQHVLFQSIKNIDKIKTQIQNQISNQQIQICSVSPIPRRSRISKQHALDRQHCDKRNRNTKSFFLSNFAPSNGVADLPPLPATPSSPCVALPPLAVPQCVAPPWSSPTPSCFVPTSPCVVPPTLPVPQCVAWPTAPVPPSFPKPLTLPPLAVPQNVVASPLVAPQCVALPPLHVAQCVALPTARAPPSLPAPSCFEPTPPCALVQALSPLSPHVSSVRPSVRTLPRVAAYNRSKDLLDEIERDIANLCKSHTKYYKTKTLAELDDEINRLINYYYSFQIPPPSSCAMPPVIIQNHIPPPTSSDSELIDWFLTKMKLNSGFEILQSDPASTVSSVPSSPEEIFSPKMDIRHLSLSRDLREFLIHYPKLIPLCEDIKSPFDYWAFLEPVFSPPLSASFFSNPSLSLPPSEDTSTMHAPYHWQWALEDCIDTSELTDIERELILKKISPRNSISNIQESIRSTHEFLAHTNASLNEHLLKLQKSISSLEKSDLQNFKAKFQSLSSMFQISERLILKLQREQILDSIEQIQLDDEGRIILIIDDGETVAGFTVDDLSILDERDKTMQPEMETHSIQYPFNSKSKLPQIGPFCHICRQPVPESNPCSHKKSATAAVCPRRFCNECLVAYNWPQATPETRATWKCAICLKLCTCDRCVRAVFIKSLTAFSGRPTTQELPFQMQPTQLSSTPPRRVETPTASLLTKRFRRSR